MGKIHILVLFLLLSITSFAFEDSLKKIEGTWYVNMTNFKMWLTGKKTNATFNYWIEKRKDVVGLKDHVIYTQRKKIKKYKGFDKPLNNAATSFVWRGDGLLFFIKTKANSNLYTSSNGNELIFNSNFNMALSDTTNRKLSSFNGVGASADIYFETTYKSKIGKKSVLLVNANNLGFIHWLNNSVQYNSDASLKFSGYNVNNIADLKDSTLNKINRDTLLRDLSNARKENFNVNIPTNLVIINKVFFGKDKEYCLSTGYRYIFNANYKSYIFIEPEYKYKKMSFALHTGYGGYVRINIGLWMMWNNKDWFMRIGSNSLQGYFLPKTAYGQGLYFSLAKKFK